MIYFLQKKININNLFQLIIIKNKYEKSHLYIKNELFILNYILIYK